MKIRLGKKAARRDERTLAMRTLFASHQRVPVTYIFDDQHPGIPLPMFANDVYGDCVIAGRAHQTLRFELQEQKRLIAITDQEVIQEYLRESGGQDSGLVMLDSLNAWRRRGWKVGGEVYKIQAYAAINPKRKIEVQQVAFADLGVYCGFSLPISAQGELEAGKPWAKTTGRDTTPGGWGGHCVYCCGYNKAGPVGITWGRRQQMTWAWFAKYCDEAYAVVDAVNTSKKRLLIDEEVLSTFLAGL